MALAIVACGYYWLYLGQSHQRLRVGTIEQIEKQATQLAETVSRQLSILVRLIDFSVIGLRDTLSARDERFFQDAARGVINTFPPGAIQQIGFINGYGHLIYSTLGVAERIYMGNRDYFKFHLEHEEDRLFIGHPAVDYIAQVWTIPFTRAIREQGRFDGVIFVSINPHYIAKSLLLPDSGADDVFAVIFTDGAFVARSQHLDKVLGKSIAPDWPFIGVDAPPFGIANLTSEIDQVRRISAWRRLDDFPLVILVGLAETSILEPVEQSIREARRRAQLSMAVLLALAAGIVTLLLRVERDERLLHENEKFLGSIVENIPAMIFVKDATDLRFIKFNKAGEELLGYSQQVLLGLNDHDFFPKEEADFFTAKDREVLDALSVIDIPEEAIETKFGRKFLHTRKISVADRQGKPQFLIGISVDITDHKLLQDMEKMRRLILEMLASSQSLDAILAYIANLIEQHSREALCSILLLDKEGQHLLHGAAPSLPKFYNQAINGVAISPEVGSCGAAAFLGTRVITNQVNPRLCRGDSNSLTVPGVHQETPCREPPKHTMKENPDGQTSKPKPHHLGVQISCGVYPEVSSSDALRAAKTASGRGVSQSGPAEGEHD